MSPSTPFIAEHIHHIGSSTSYFTPQARLVVETATLRQNGLLATLTDESARTLLAVLCFLTANGRAEPTAHQVAGVLGTSVGKTRERLLRLSAIRFADDPILHIRRTESGLEMFGVSSCVLISREEEADEEAAVPLVMPSHREAITEHSRAAHARPRAEVERIVLEQLGLSEPETFDDSPEGDLRKRLAAIGMPRDMATALIEGFGLDAVMKQLGWLPHRGAKDPARYLAAAVRGQYAEPPEVARERLRKAVNKDEHQPASPATPSVENPVVSVNIPEDADGDRDR